MEVMIVLIGFSILAAAGFLAAFIWALRRGQFDDLSTPAFRILFGSATEKRKRDQE